MKHASSKRTAMNTHIKLNGVSSTFATYQRGRYFVDIWVDGTWNIFNVKGLDCQGGEYRVSPSGRYCFVAAYSEIFPEEVIAALRRHFKAIIVLQSNRWFFKKRPNYKEIWL